MFILSMDYVVGNLIPARFKVSQESEGVNVFSGLTVAEIWVVCPVGVPVCWMSRIVAECD